MTREALPPRRPHEVRDLVFEGHAYTMGVDDSADPREVFVSAIKAGSGMAALARDGAILISIALQHGAPLGTLRSALTRDGAGGPASVIGAVVDAMEGGP